MEVSASFGVWLKERREQLHLTQAELAGCVGCSAITIRKIEADERRPSRQVAELLAACLEIAPEDRPTFLKMARTELRVKHLSSAASVSLLLSQAGGEGVVAQPSPFSGSLPNLPTSPRFWAGSTNWPESPTCWLTLTATC